MAIVMLANFSPEELPGAPPSQVSTLTDTASYNDAWTAVKQVMDYCISKYLIANETTQKNEGEVNFRSDTGWSAFGTLSFCETHLADCFLKQASSCRESGRYWCLPVGDKFVYESKDPLSQPVSWRPAVNWRAIAADEFDRSGDECVIGKYGDDGDMSDLATHNRAGIDQILSRAEPPHHHLKRRFSGIYLPLSGYTKAELESSIVMTMISKESQFAISIPLSLVSDLFHYLHLLENASPPWWYSDSSRSSMAHFSFSLFLTVLPV